MPVSGAVAAELEEIALRLADLAAGNIDGIPALRPLLHRAVGSTAFGSAAKTYVVQALLLLDDPRLGNHAPAGKPLVFKLRKLLAAALAAQRAQEAQGAQASDVESALPGNADAARLELGADALISSDVDRALVAEFIVESREQLTTAERALLALDADPEDVGALESMFRALHTIKGTSAFFGVEHITALAHHAESSLARVRSGAAVCGGELSNLLFRSIDMLDAMMVAIENVVDGGSATLPHGFHDLLKALDDDCQATERDDTTPRVSGSVLRVRSAESMLRIRAGDLDRLVGVVRELVLTHGVLSRDATLRTGAHPDLARKIGHAQALVFELDDLANGLRNVAFSSTMQKVARIARDAAYHSGKSIELVTDGEDVLVERAVAEALADPLMHMVRNAVDHGIEPRDERMRAGKPGLGCLRIRAQHIDGELVIELADDGRGLDPRRLVQMAIARGMISPTAALSDAEALLLIMRPGFTTVEVVTGLSGRGVGMDVVRSSIESLGGTIEISSRVGEGTTFTIRLPFHAQSARTDRASSVDTWGEPPRMIGLSA